MGMVEVDEYTTDRAAASVSVPTSAQAVDSALTKRRRRSALKVQSK